MKKVTLFFTPQRHKYVWFLLLAPALLSLIFIVIYPMIFSLSLSFHQWNIIRPGGWTLVGLSNYIEILFHDSYFYSSLKTTLIYLLGTIPIQFGLGLLIALILQNVTQKISGFLRTTLIIPTIMTPIVVGIIWRLMYNPDMGTLNYFLDLFHLAPINWVGMPNTALLSVMVADIWEWTPFMALILLAGLQSLPTEPFEAALVDGASFLQMFRFITLPLLIPTMLVALLIRIIDSFKTFDIIFVLTQGGPGRATETMNYFTYRYGFKFFHMGYTSALSWILLMIVTIISMLLIKIFFIRRVIER